MNLREYGHWKQSLLNILFVKIKYQQRVSIEEKHTIKLITTVNIKHFISFLFIPFLSPM